MTPAPRGRPRRRTSSAAGLAGLHQAWLELLTTSGPFLTVPVAARVWPDGLPGLPPEDRARARALLADLLDGRGGAQRATVRAVLSGVLGWGDRLAMDDELPAALAVPVVEHHTTVRPDFGFRAPDSDPDEADEAGQPWRMLGMVSPYGAHPLTRRNEDGWAASPVERLAVLLRAHDVPVGLVTDGRWWALVWAPRGGTIAAAAWDGSLWSEEPVTLQAFVALLGRARFLGVPDADILPALFEESLQRQEEITDRLGVQVRNAVELLVDTLSSADRDSAGALLADVPDEDLYAGAVTVMMRLVFLLFAEERRLLPSDDEIYVVGYSVGRLVEQLESDAALGGEQTLEYRTGAWHRLLAVSRAVARGVEHEDLRMPAYGGSLFDPDRFPWLEGREAGNPAGSATPPAIDDRTVLAMLRAVQYVELLGERRRLTFRALDVEQIGYVYEGLLELEVRTATGTTLGFVRPPSWPGCKQVCEVPLAAAQAALGDDGVDFVGWLAQRTPYSPAKLRTALETPAERERREQIHAAVDGDEGLTEQLLPFAGVLRSTMLDRPSIWRKGDRYVAPSTRRASSGTHYTPRSLAEEIVSGALEALVYRPGPLETSEKARWRLRPSSELLDLRVADIAMGSGAFLVATCRWLADRVVEAWETEGRLDAARHVSERAGRTLAVDAEVDDVLLEARRAVADKCLYGVDINPLAVEMAKLSLWLVTMDRQRPFGFLDDRFVSGDSLLGLVSFEQVEALHPDPASKRAGHQQIVLGVERGARDVLEEAADLRKRIVAHESKDLRAIEFKMALLGQAESITSDLTAACDYVVGAALAAAGTREAALRNSLDAGAARAEDALTGESGTVAAEARHLLERGRPAAAFPRRPLHWPVAFPDVMVDRDRHGFDAIVGNPPFLGGKKISGALGTDYLDWLQRWDGESRRGSADIVARFVLRSTRLLNDRGQLAVIATNTLVQGDTLEVGLEQVTDDDRLVLRRGRSSHPWPTRGANLEIVECWGSRRPLEPRAARELDGEEVPASARTSSRSAGSSGGRSALPRTKGSPSRARTYSGSASP